MDDSAKALPLLTAQTIESKELALTPLQVTDAPAMVAVLDDPALYLYTGGQPPTREELARKYTRQVKGASPDGSQRWLNWIVRTQGTAVGYVQATVQIRGQMHVAEMAWVIGVPWQGQGFAARSSLLAKEWLEIQGVQGFTASIHPDHAASAAVAARLGLVRSGGLTDEGEEVWGTPGLAVESL